MKALLSILLVSAVIFIGIAMAQEWQVFASAWFGYRPEVPPISETDQKESAESLRHYLTLTGHLYRSNGDTRFLERLPAAPRVTDELMADIVYLRHNGRYQEPSLERLECDEFRLLAPESIEIVTREFWIIRTRSLVDGKETDPVLSGIIRARYRMAKEASGWKVQAWELVSPPLGSVEEPRP